MHVDITTIQIDGVPQQGNHFRDTQSVAIAHQDQRGVAMTMASLASSSLDQPMNLVLGEIFSRTYVGVFRLARR
jgi:hypothetical protein